MLNKTMLLLLTLMLTVTAFSQGVKRDAQKVETKMESFASKTGILVKFIDTKLPAIKLSYGAVAEARIRKIISESEVKYFYQIGNQGKEKYNTSSASIDYADLLEIIKAIKTLKTDFDKDVALHPDYLENQFRTTDDFQVGYYVSKSKASWFLRLESYGSEHTFFLKDGDSIETAFTEAINKIDELKNSTPTF